jgi:hypothetical protein
MATIATAGCAAETEPGVEAIDSVEQAYSLISCPNDVPTSGYVEFPYNDNHYGYWVNFKPDCVSMRVDRNVPFPEHLAVQAHAGARFPQYEGIYTATKEAQCRNSKVEMFIAKKWIDSSSWADEGIEGWGDWAEPDIDVILPDPPQVPYYVINSCHAHVTRGAMCDYHPDRNLMRLDVRAVANGNAVDPGPAYVSAELEHDVFCN